MAPNVPANENRLDRAIEEAERLFVEAGRAKIKAEALDERRKRVRAVLFTKYRGEGKGSGESEQYAMADKVYEAACIDWEMAAMDAETLKAQAEAKRLRFDAWRTSESTRRAAMQLR